MEKNRNGKGFLKSISISTAGILVLSMALWATALDLRNGMILIVLATDTLVYIEGNGHAPDSVDQQRVQDMVNAVIGELTDIIDDMPLAYEMIFPPDLTIDSKILIKYNPKTPETTRKPLTEALKTGLTYMFDYTFPPDNITIVGDEGTQSFTDTIMVDSTVIVRDTTIFTFDSLGNPDTIIVFTATTIFAFDSDGNPDTIQVPTPPPTDTIPGLDLQYTIKDIYSNTDYIIYCPSAWGTDIGCGVDMNLSLMLTSIDGIDTATKVEDMYPFFHDTISPSLSILNYYPTFNGDIGKPVLYLMDLLSYSGTGSPDDVKPCYRITATRNITVSDWKGIRFLKDSVGVLSEEHEQQALKVCSLSVIPIDLGVVNEGQMTEIFITMNTGISTQGNVKIRSRDIRVIINPAHTVFIYPRTVGSPAVFSIFNVRGREIWSYRGSGNGTVIWNNKDNSGKSVSSGKYLFQLKTGDIKAQGTTTINQ